MPTFANGESGSSVRNKINTAITTVDGLGSGDNLLMSATERTKLAGIETGATADQTGAEIKTAYEGEANTNAFTDAEQTKLAGIETGAEVNDVDSVAGLTGAITASGLRTAINVEDGATADQTGSEIVTSINTELGGTTWQSGGGGGSALEVEDEGVSLSTAVTKINFVGSGVTATEPVADEITVTIAGGAAPVDSVNTQTGAVVLDADDIDDTSTTHKFATAAQLTKLDNITELADPGSDSIPFFDVSGGSTAYFTALTGLTITGTTLIADVQSVNTQTGAVVLDADDISDTSTTNKFATQAQLDDAQTEVVTVCLFEAGEDVTTGDKAGNQVFRVPAKLNGYNLTGVACYVDTAGTTGTTDVQIHNITDAADMLSTVMTIDSGETDTNTAATAAVINGANDDVATADKIRFDVDAVSTTAPQGLWVELTFEAP